MVQKQVRSYFKGFETSTLDKTICEFSEKHICEVQALWAPAVLL